MVKLVQNELIKIFKRKSIYVLLTFSVLGIIIFNYMNPDQNPESIKAVARDRNIQVLEDNLEKYNNDMEEYINQKSAIDLAKIYNKYEVNSWQRYAINEETLDSAIGDFQMGSNQDILENIKIVNDFELNKNTKIKEEDYKVAKGKIRQYIEILDSNDWKEFVKLKIKNFEEAKNKILITKQGAEKINLEIQMYQMRLQYDIKYGDSGIKNQYLDIYREQNYMLEYLKTINKNDAAKNQEILQCKAKIALIKYAIENNIKQDISPENFNIILNNKIDARNSLVRTFENFDILIVIISIYISCTTIVEETNKGTIKNILIKPHKRSTIIISKILACLFTLVIVMLFFIITQYIVGGVIFGFNSYKLEFIGYDYNNEQIFTMNLLGYVLLIGLAKLPMYIIISTFCIFMSVVNNNMAMTIILTLGIFIVANSIIAEWSKIGEVSVITRFFITNNWDFSKYLFGQISNINGINLALSVLIYITHVIVIFYFLIKKFNEKEVENV